MSVSRILFRKTKLKQIVQIKSYSKFLENLQKITFLSFHFVKNFPNSYYVCPQLNVTINYIKILELIAKSYLLSNEIQSSPFLSWNRVNFTSTESPSITRRSLLLRRTIKRKR